MYPQFIHGTHGPCSLTTSIYGGANCDSSLAKTVPQCEIFKEKLEKQREEISAKAIVMIRVVFYSLPERSDFTISNFGNPASK